MTYAADPLHDEINLRRLVRRLEKATSEPWDESPRQRAWIKAQGTLQKVKFARRLLKNVDMYEEEPTPKRVQQLNGIRITLDKAEAFVKEVEQRTAPIPTRPPSILATIPRPPPPASSLTLDLPPLPTANQPEGESAAPVLHTDDLLLPADTPAFPSSTSFSFPTPMPLIPTLPSPAEGNATAVSTGLAPRFLQNSTALQQELSDQLAQMATQLKRNAQHFSDTLARDQAVVEETQTKLEGNFDVMQKERIRLRDHRGKSGGTTCLVVLIVVMVVLLFMLMVSIIRFT
ncbi:putative membrane fusion protein Use1 [Lyophyllum shimeji]|uniref:Membrane fusion protein Use1 n=1 Tax=Lyophyllum shimeji TaxID=47721 RepID=A0A9P3Q0E7_LYOSH|nr:putative membrane fusion protein Use1 [Lyophyllum shimeji]